MMSDQELEDDEPQEHHSINQRGQYQEDKDELESCCIRKDVGIPTEDDFDVEA